MTNEGRTMKYIEIDLNRAVELFRQGEFDKVFRQCDNGELEKVTSLQDTFKRFIIYYKYFERIVED